MEDKQKEICIQYEKIIKRSLGVSHQGLNGDHAIYFRQYFFDNKKLERWAKPEDENPEKEDKQIIENLKFHIVNSITNFISLMGNKMDEKSKEDLKDLTMQISKSDKSNLTTYFRPVLDIYDKVEQ